MVLLLTSFLITNDCLVLFSSLTTLGSLGNSDCLVLFASVMLRLLSPERENTLQMKKQSNVCRLHSNMRYRTCTLHHVQCPRATRTVLTVYCRSGYVGTVSAYSM
jgi:hypothetical protein